MTATPTSLPELCLEALHRYPVKGLSPEELEQVTLEAGRYFPGDRLFAIENGPSGFDPAAPKHQPKIKFLMLMRNEALARLITRYDDETSVLTIRQGDGLVVEADLSTPEGREAVEAFFRAEFADSLRGPPRLLAAPDGFRFTDSARGFVSLLNLASVAATQDMVGAPVDPLRFRANLHLTGLPPFAELDLVGRILATAGGVRLRISKRTERCAATNVDPATGIRDLAIPRTLSTRLGHADCGVYAEVLHGGRLERGETLRIEA
ncbi:MOSC domain-containing protein [Methylobacterium sp. Leaf85]|uniref:MOSC domain-containing protein n=1 Tax=Methylobacterium sp. Leaf85 TaxID=1736241 RepID=UPI000700542D|nr:MOSC N-terminal beta barrel domain-containing protein [Methylobacterium sp. Leaf85]KQO54950.1 molybdenum cofactor sulfurase [Methylobacterium sp. Leaf85]